MTMHHQTVQIQKLKQDDAAVRRIWILAWFCIPFILKPSSDNFKYKSMFFIKDRQTDKPY